MPFAGFDPPESNFWRLPNEWFDLAAHFTSWAEHKVVEYILRHTWGYHEYGTVKLITMDEFMHGRKRRDGSRIDAGCGMAENSIKKGIHDAVAHGFLLVQTDDSDKGRIKKYYAPRMRRPQTDEGLHSIHLQGQSLLPEGQASIPNPQALTLGVLPLTPEPQLLTPRPQVVDSRTGQVTLARNMETETRSNNTMLVAIPLSDSTRQARHGRSVAQPIDSGRRTPLKQARLSTSTPPFRADLVARLVSEGIAPARARLLVAEAPSEQIERQLAWIEYRTCRDRAATLVRAIVEDFSEPARKAAGAHGQGSDRAKYFRGSYALCPICGSRPCAPGCAESSQ